MHSKRIIILILGLFLFSAAIAQEKISEREADVQSLALYNAGNWKDLLHYGKSVFDSGSGFALLGMRTGYAAFMLKNYSESLIYYRNVYDSDAENKVALYYVYLDNLYLNNTIAAKYYSQKLTDETKAKEKIEGTKFSGVQVEFSNRMPDDTARRDAQYARAGVNIDIGYRFQLQQSLAYYTLFQNTLLPNNTTTYLDLKQPEYYAKLIFAINGQWSLFGAYHFISDQFPDSTLKTNIFMGGIKFASPFVSIQADAGFGNFAINYSQYDGIVTVYPLGNLNLYSISRISFAGLSSTTEEKLPPPPPPNRNPNTVATATTTSQTNFTEVIGARLSKSIWIEGNTTLGQANYLFDNDALYVKNDPDLLLFRCGASLYTQLSKNLLLSINYTFEQKKEQYTQTTNNYFQNSINGGLSWKF